MSAFSNAAITAAWIVCSLTVSPVNLPMTFLKFTRGFESEADYLGVEYMYKAGYDPQAFITFFEKIAVLEKHKPGAVAKAFSTHPQTPDRVEKTQQEIRTLLPERMQYKLDTSEFEDVKARLAELENRHVLPNQNDERRPTLRRASHNDKNGDDDRPVLKRRDDNDDFVSPSSHGLNGGLCNTHDRETLNT